MGGRSGAARVKSPRRGVHDLSFSLDGKTLGGIGEFEPFIYEWDVKTGLLRSEVELRDEITLGGLAFHP